MATKKTTKTSVETVKTTAAKSTVPEKTPTVKAAPAGGSADNKTAVEQKVPAENKTAEVKTTAKKNTKSAVAKKPAAKKEIKIKTVVEYYGKQVDEKDIIANVKKAWTKSGKKVGDIKDIELYIKPEEAAVYYVINKTETGAVAF